jgi:cytoplasmic iron level regulating protein YaaA (DUF328/UPF0246 family)
VRNPVILIPPSEGKTTGGRGAPWAPGTMLFDLDDARARVLREARLDVGAAPTRPAIERYSGVLYRELGYRNLDRATRRRIDAQVVIFSGVWGLVAPRDPIPEYKRKMGAAAGRLGRLALWWRPRLTPVLDTHVRRQVVWDLLPHEHEAAWPASAAPASRIRVRFLEEHGRGKKRRLTTVSHWNKLLKGALVRHLVAAQLTEPAGLAEFRHPEGYAYRAELTVVEHGRIVACMVRSH